MTQTKVCRVCLIDKPLELFNNAKRNKDKRNTRCKACTKVYQNELYKNNPKSRQRRDYNRTNYKRLTRYGINNQEYIDLLTSQGNRCAICRIVIDNQTPKSSGFIDHCHTTEKVRGLVCNICNIGLGSFRDNPDNLLAAVNYLNRSRNND